MGHIRIGTCSWADRALTASGWYPREANTTAGRLIHYAGRFDLVAADTARHAITGADVTAAWAERTPPGFTFDITAFGLFTGHPTPVDRLPADLRPAGRREPVRRADLGPDTWAELWRRFHAGLRPLADAGKLGVILLQFPDWFRHGDAALRRILHTVEECRPHRVAVELAHPSWYDDGRALPTLRFLQEHDISYGCLDETYRHGPIVVTTADPAVVRLRREHDHAALARWAGHLRSLAPDTTEMHVLLDTPGGRAPLAAARLAELISQDPRAPATISGAGDRYRALS